MPEAVDREAVAYLQQVLNQDPTLVELLVQKGIRTFEDARDFFRPKLEQLHDPFLMQDMEKAVNRLVEAMAAEEKILIYGDYDVDGTTSVATVYGFLSQYYQHLSYYIPDRYTEGYGLSSQGIEHAAKEGFKLLITIDCGIKATDKIVQANAEGIDVIVCDHHTPGELPPAYAILDPKRIDCNYPYKELSGCGVGFKLLEALCIQTGMDVDKLYEYLDLLAVSIASDIVPITGENRILAYYGLKQLSTTTRPGLKALHGHRSHEQTTISKVVFGMAPKINAAGRVAHASAAVDLMLAKTTEEAKQLLEAIELNNDKRKNLDQSATKEAIALIEQEGETDKKTTVLYNKNWSKGVVGIVASRCIESYYRPTIILTHSNGKITGSVRSVHNFDVYEALLDCTDVLEQFGGHQYAAGLTLEEKNLPAFKEKFEQAVALRIKEEHLRPVIRVDARLNFQQLEGGKFYRVLSQMGPFGPGNMQPVFWSSEVKAKTAKKLKDKHLSMTLTQDGTDVEFKAIAFNMGEYIKLVNSGLPFDVAFSLEENHYNGVSSIQLHVKDLKFDN